MTPVLPAVGPWSGVSAVSPSISSMRSTRDAELLADHLPHGDAMAGAEVDLARIDDHRAVGADGEEGVDRQSSGRLRAAAFAAAAAARRRCGRR